MEIYTGTWKDESSGKLLLTLDLKTGGFLAAALVLWVTLVGNATWSFCRFAIWSIPTRRDEVFYLQRQALLRNSSSSTEALASLVQLVYEWRHRRFLVRTIPHLFITILLFVSWPLAAFFVPYVHTRSPSQVLLAHSSHCGQVMPPQMTVPDQEHEALYRATERASLDESEAYVRQCYGSEDSPSCTTLPRQYLGFGERVGLPCPLASPELCLTTNSTVLQLDTGLLDSNRDFGINTKASESVQYRRVATCSPFYGGSFVTNKSETSIPGYPNASVLFFDLGHEDGRDFTFRYASNQQHLHIPYTTVRIFHRRLNDSSSWIPDARLFNASDADFSFLVILANGVMSNAPNYDPLFGASLPLRLPSNWSDGSPMITYTAPYIATFLACIEQHQLCFPSLSGQCTPLTDAIGLGTALNSIDGLHNHAAPSILADRFLLAVHPSIFDPFLWKGAGGSSLLASRTLNDFIQPAPLPQDHWQKEVRNLFSIVLASIQKDMFAYAAGPSDPRLYPFVKLMSGAEALSSMCSTQRSRAARQHINFDLRALIVVFVLGAVLIIMGLYFDWLLGQVAAKSPIYQLWLAEGLFHEQKRGLEASRGLRGWFDLSETIPKTTRPVPSGAWTGKSADDALLEGFDPGQQPRLRMTAKRRS